MTPALPTDAAIPTMPLWRHHMEMASSWTTFAVTVSLFDIGPGQPVMSAVVRIFPALVALVFWIRTWAARKSA